MGAFIKGFIPVFLVLSLLQGLSQLVVNSRLLSLSHQLLQGWLTKQAQSADLYKWTQLERHLWERVQLYERQLQGSHLLDGMVVNRLLDGRAIDQCDSLLFSSLRYVSLKKLGLEAPALQAWQAISVSEKAGKWFRHPGCDHRTSRDMILGLLLAFSQSPPEGAAQIQRFFKYLEKNGGYFGDGPFYVSYLTPGLAESFRRLAPAYTLVDLPATVARGFSTLEFDGLFAAKGYRAHLIALQVWLELELHTFAESKGFVRQPRSALWEAAQVLAPFTLESIYQQRLTWVSQQLLKLDPKNLFFRWLRLKAGGLDDAKLRLGMLEELLAMPQFPQESLPQDCHRQADYLWQRDSREFMPRRECSRQFSGVDFLWMASLLVTMPPNFALEEGLRP